MQPVLLQIKHVSVYKESYTTDYVTGDDAIKMMSLNAEVPQIYTVIGNYQYSVNALPTSITEVSLVAKLMKAGTYTITMENVTTTPSYSKVLLVDGTSETNLLEGNYTTTVSQALTKSLKIKLVKKATTEIETTATEKDIEVNTVNKGIYIKGLDGNAQVNVYNLSGQLVQSFNGVANNEILILGNKGINVLNIITDTQTAQTKVLIK